MAIASPTEWAELALATGLVAALVVLPFVWVRGDVTSGRRDPGYEEPPGAGTDRAERDRDAG
jgi:hypothetical protein